MSYAPRESYQQPWGVAPLASQADEWERTLFVRRTYLHLLGAVIAFVLLETLAFAVIPQATMEQIVYAMMGRWTWLLIIGGFMVVSWIARTWASGEMSPTMQYAGLGLYVVAQAVLFLPLLGIAVYFLDDPNKQLLPSAAFITLFIFGGLTAINFLTKYDFSFLGKYLFFAGIAIFGVILCAIFFDMTLGVWFSIGLILLASAYILYDTSNIIHHYRTNQHVAAALALFASVALLFWYVLNLLLSMRR